MVYVAVFLGSTLFMHLATLADRKRMKTIVFLCSLICMLLPIVLAGLRGATVGTDMNYYVLPNFQVATRSSSYVQFTHLVYAKEPLYLALVYVAAKLFGNFQALLFILQTIVIGGFYIGIWRIRKNFSVALTYFVYLLMYFNSSLNILRQFLAISILVIGLKELLDGKYKSYFIYILIATLFHTTALLSLILVLIRYFEENPLIVRSSRQILLTELLLTTILGGTLISFPLIIPTMIRFGLLNSRYITYVQDSNNSNNLSLLTLLLFEVTVVVLYRVRLSHIVYKFEFFKMNLVVLTMLTLFANQIYYGERLGVLFGVVNTLFLSKIASGDPEKSNRFVLRILLIIILLVYWWYIFVHAGVGQTYPYIPFWK